MKTWIAIILLMLTGRCATANDGAFFASGSTLFPLTETTIALDKEHLQLTRSGNHVLVDVQFEFNNPGPDKEILVGFVTPPASGDIDVKNENHPQVSDYRVTVNGVEVESKIVRMSGSGFKLSAATAGGDDFVYYFKMKFPHGVSHIHHSYKYRCGTFVYLEANVYYRLTTGTQWANHEIRDFTLDINMGSNVFFGTEPDFGTLKNPAWQVVGTGRIATKSMHSETLNDLQVLPVFIRSGTLHMHVLHFKPVHDLFIDVFNRWSDPVFWTASSAGDVLLPLVENIDSLNVSSLSDWQLRLLINLPYARNGYDFKDNELKAAFERYYWYVPDPAAKPVFNNYYYDIQTAANLEAENKRRHHAQH